MTLPMIRAEGWAPHPGAAPRNRVMAAAGQHESAANGTRSCCGGWQFVYRGVEPGHRYRITWQGEWVDLAVPGDALVGHVYWGEMGTDAYVPGPAMIWDYVGGVKVRIT